MEGRALCSLRNCPGIEASCVADSGLCVCFDRGVYDYTTSTCPPTQSERRLPRCALSRDCAKGKAVNESCLDGHCMVSCRINSDCRSLLATCLSGLCVCSDNTVMGSDVCVRGETARMISSATPPVNTIAVVGAVLAVIVIVALLGLMLHHIGSIRPIPAYRTRILRSDFSRLNPFAPDATCPLELYPRQPGSTPCQLKNPTKPGRTAPPISMTSSVSSSLSSDISFVRPSSYSNHRGTSRYRNQQTPSDSSSVLTEDSETPSSDSSYSHDSDIQRHYGYNEEVMTKDRLVSLAEVGTRRSDPDSTRTTIDNVPSPRHAPSFHTQNKSSYGQKDPSHLDFVPESYQTHQSNRSGWPGGAKLNGNGKASGRTGSLRLHSQRNRSRANSFVSSNLSRLIGFSSPYAVNSRSRSIGSYRPSVVADGLLSVPQGVNRRERRISIN